MRSFEFMKDINNTVSPYLEDSDYTDTVKLLADTATAVVAPTLAEGGLMRVVVFPVTDCFYNPATFSLPTATTTNGQAPKRVPGNATRNFTVASGATFYLRAALAQQVEVAYYKK